MFGYRLQKIWKLPSVSQIERTLSELADKYGNGDIWLYGNYYERLFNELDDVQIMYDPSRLQALDGIHGRVPSGLRAQNRHSSQRR